MKEDIEQEAIQIVESEVSKYKDGEFFITENVAIATRPLIRHLRKNYWGVFEQSKDPVTGKDKQWVPLTRLVVDAVRKNSDLDLKDVNFRANNEAGVPVTSLVRGFVRKWLYNNFFGEVLNDSILQMCIDGTVVWKTYTQTIGGKLHVKRKTVDILNIFIDPTADSIQDAQRFTERALLSVDQVKAMDGWMKTDGVKSASGLHRTDADLKHINDIGEYVDVYEMWGLIPKRLISGNKDDAELVPGHVVISGIETGDRRVHVLEANTNKDKNGDIVKPYEELRFIKVPGRWAGVGPAEMVMKLQEWINTIINLRIQKNTSASLGLFKVKAGAGVTQQMLSNLISRGVIKLNNMDDLDNFRIDEAGESSYKDEEVAKNWAFDITSTYDIARGASLPASTTATSAVIEDRNSKTAFTLVIESTGLFLQRWMDRHFLPHVPKLIRQEKTTTLFGDFDDIDEIRHRIASYLVMQEMDKNYSSSGFVPTTEDIQMAIQETEQKLRGKKNIFMDVLEDIIAANIDTVAQFTNEELDVAVTVRNLTDMANSVEDPTVRNDFLMRALDILGIDVPESMRKPQMPGMTQDVSTKPFIPNEQQLTTAANVPYAIG
jgi:hypothetical protein